MLLALDRVRIWTPGSGGFRPLAQAFGEDGLLHGHPDRSRSGAEPGEPSDGTQAGS